MFNIGGDFLLNIKIPFTKHTFNISIPKSINPLDDGYYDGSFSNIFSTDGKKNSTEQLKAYEGWVGDCCSLIAERCASIPLRLYKDGELIEKHQFLRPASEMESLHYKI